MSAANILPETAGLFYLFDLDMLLQFTQLSLQG